MLDRSRKTDELSTFVQSVGTGALCGCLLMAFRDFLWLGFLFGAVSGAVGAQLARVFPSAWCTATACSAGGALSWTYVALQAIPGDFDWVNAAFGAVCGLMAGLQANLRHALIEGRDESEASRFQLEHIERD